MTFSPTSWPSGGLAPNGIALALSAPSLAAIDFHIAGLTLLRWDLAYDDLYDFNPITAMPANLGMDILIDGSGGDITTLVDGVWSYAVQFTVPADATLRGFVNCNLGLGRRQFDPTDLAAVTGQDAVLVYSSVVQLPAGAQGACLISTAVAATANPLHPTSVNAVFSRLA